jgi:hypothetical protein
LVRRSVKVQESNSLSGDAYNAVELEASLEIIEPPQITPAWSFPLTAMVLYRDDTTREWVLVATTSSCDVIFERGNPRYLFDSDRPPTVYFEFRLRGKTWHEVPLAKTSVGRAANLLQSYKALSRRHVTPAIRASLDGNPMWSEENKKIVEAPRHTCGQTTNTQPIWESEDKALAALDKANAPLTDQKRVMELFAGTRIIYVHDKVWRIDADPKTVQYVNSAKPEVGGSGVSDDGQVIYDDFAPYNNDAGLIRDSYAQQLKHAGLGRYAE